MPARRRAVRIDFSFSRRATASRWIMAILQRLASLVREDFSALIPGSGVALNRESILRLVLYVAFFALLARLLWPIFFQTESPEFHGPVIERIERTAPVIAANAPPRAAL